MLKKYSTLILVLLIINLFLSSSVFAETKVEKEAKQVEKVRLNINKLGTGEKAKLEVKLKDGKRLKGYVYSISADQFVVMNENTGIPESVSYTNVTQVKGNNLSTGVKIAIGVAIFFVVFVIIGLAAKD